MFMFFNLSLSAHKITTKNPYTQARTFIFTIFLHFLTPKICIFQKKALPLCRIR